MSRTTLFFLFAILILTVVGCQNDDSTVAPANPEGSSNQTVDPVFKAQLEGEIESEEQEVQPFAHNWHDITGPTIITQPGAYRVINDFSVADTGSVGILVGSHHVLLYLGGHTISGLDNKRGTGVLLDSVHHVLVFGGRVQTIGTGVAVVGSHHCAVKGMAVIGGDEFADPPNGIPPQIGILLLNSSMCKVTWNGVQDINLGLFVRGGQSEKNHLFFNHVLGGDNGLLAICYNPAPGEGDAGPQRDNVRFNNLERFPIGISTSEGSAHNRFFLNTIKYFDQAWRDLNGTNVFVHNRTMMITR